MNTDKEFVPYQPSLDMKELGFDEPCFGRFNNEGDLVIAHTEKYIISNGVDRSKFFTLAPLYQQAFRWFRDKYKIFSSIMTEYSYGGTISAYHINGLHQSDISKGDFYTYEEAELACLIKLIKLVKNK